MAVVALSGSPLLPKSGNLPMLISAPEVGMSLADATMEISMLAEQHLPLCGGLLMRGFDVGNINGFHAFAESFGHPLLSYEFGSTPRSNVAKGVYTSTEYPAHQSIPLHSEQAYTLSWPMKIWFYCVTSAPNGGETPIADNRLVYRSISSSIRERLSRHGLMYVRNYGGGLDVAWQNVFNTQDRQVVERYCRENAIEFAWKEDGELRTWQRCQAVAQHPHTKEWVWFNQAHLFHVSNLQAEVREALLDIVEEQDLPRNVYYGDGSPIEDSLLEEVRGVLDQSKVMFPWQSGDILMLDNMLASHAREPFSGNRKVVVAMAEAFNATMP